MAVATALKPLQTALTLFKVLPLVSHMFVTNDSLLVVGTQSGLIRGSTMTSSRGHQFLSFRGIPYAKAPVHELRFQDPVEVEPWSGIFDATKESPECPQYEPVMFTLRGTEDCLRLNVYTHSTDARILKRPVMVYIHEGVWSYGSGNGEKYLHGPKYLMDRDVVLVTINYRLGALGFLSTEDNVAPGNYGLLDQTMALQWVKRNIAAFGGDPDLITVFGNSAGSVSVEHHILSPRSQGLFSRAIMQSGSALCFWSVVSSNLHYTKLLAAELKCPVSPSNDLITCLRRRDAVDIVRFRARIHRTTMWPTVFGPRIDAERTNPFLPKPPAEIFRSGEYNKVPIITGVNQDEAGIFIAGLLSGGGGRMRRFEQGFPSSLPSALGMEMEPRGQEKSMVAYKRYFGDMKYPSRDLRTFSKMLSDATFHVCFQESVKYHTQYNTAVYTYLYTHRSSLTIPLILGIPRSFRDLGVSHSDEMLAQFNVPVFSSMFRRPEDVRMTDVLLDYWVSFATTGVPLSHQRSTTQWLPSTTEVSGYMELSPNPIFRNSTFFFAQDMPFWKEFYDY